MRLRVPVVVLGLAALVSAGPPAGAGMPYFPPTEVPESVRSAGIHRLADLPSQRLQAISFFLLGIVACAWVVQRIWNGLRRDFPALPRLSLGKALGVIVLWGLLFVLVLTMVSGARELMTPGAWTREGITYRLADESAPPPPTPEPDGVRRKAGLEHLWTEVSARLTGLSRQVPDRAALPPGFLAVPGNPGQEYIYVEGLDEDRFDFVLASEPARPGPNRYVLLYGGDVRLMPSWWVDQETARRSR